MILLEEKLYTSEETASILGISLRTLYRYLKKGEIEAETKTQSGTFRFTRKQIYKYLYPDKYSEIVSKLKINDSGNSSITYVDDEEFKNMDSSVGSKVEEVKKQEYVNAGVVPVVAQGLTPGGNPVITPAVNVPSQVSETLNVSKPVDPNEASKIIEERKNHDLTDELSSLEALLSPTKPSEPISAPQFTATPVAPASPQLPKEPDISQTPIPQTTQAPNAPVEPISVPVPSQPLPTNNVSQAQPVVGEKWLYFVNTNKDILDLAKEVNSLSTETGRKYAATMKGGLSLHHDISEFNLVHFYVQSEDLNWYVEQLEVRPCDEKDANICLIPTSDSTIFDSSYKLRGLNVVSDSKLIQDLMSHNEKELAKTLL